MLSDNNPKITGMNSLGIEVKQMRFDRKKKETEGLEASTAAPILVDSENIDGDTRKRKAAPVDRRKPKKIKA